MNGFDNSDSGLLKLFCYCDNKKHLLKWVDRYVLLNERDKFDEYLTIICDDYIYFLNNRKKLTFWQKIKLFFKFDNELEKQLKEEEEKLEWKEAFFYFRNCEKNFMR